MPSCFPGMDPFVESDEWEGFHHWFTACVAETLTPLVRPYYVVRPERRVYLEHHVDPGPRRIRPDVAIMHSGELPTEGSHGRSVGAAVVLTVPLPEERREAFLTIRALDTLEIVTVIEFLSPTNKRKGSDGQREYLAKREAILRSGTHLVELDLLRGGVRMPTVESLPPGDYYALVCRGNRRPQAEVYAWTLRDRMGRIPIPLAGTDPDVPLDLQGVFDVVYDRAGYDYSLDYCAALQPPLPEADGAWAAGLLSQRQGPPPPR